MASTAEATIDSTIDSEEKAVELTEELLTDQYVEVEDLSDVDRFQQRLERFGAVAPDAKKSSRALRFGMPQETTDEASKKRRLERFGTAPDANSDAQDKKRKRAERFHTATPTSAADDEAKQKRINRFGVVQPSTNTSVKNKATNNTSSASPSLTDAMKKRVERFGDVSDAAKATALDDQKAKRADRFKPITNV